MHEHGIADIAGELGNRNAVSYQMILVVFAVVLHLSGFTLAGKSFTSVLNTGIFGNITVSEKQKEVEAYTKTYYDFSDNYIITEKDNSKTTVHFFLAEREMTSRKKKDLVTFYLMETEVSQKQKSVTTKVLGQKKVNYSKKFRII